MTILRSKENCNTEPAEGKDLAVKKHFASIGQVQNNTQMTPQQDVTDFHFVRSGLKDEIAKQVVRKKLAKLRHLVLEKAVAPEYLDSLFPKLLERFHPQTVIYNGGIANVKEWKVRVC